MRPEDILRPRMMRASGGGEGSGMEDLLVNQLFKHHCAIALNPTQRVKDVEVQQREILAEQLKHIDWLHEQAGE